VESTRARIPSLESGLETALNGLAVLQGRAPGTLHSILDDIGIVPTPAKDVAVGIPADVLRQRPDIRSAERELAAQTARIGEATADLYPKVRISGSIGVETLDLNHLGTTAVWPFGYGISIEWPVFDAGRIRRNIDVQKALQEQAMARYKGAVLSALEEVENALSAYALERDRLDTLHRAASAAQEAVDLAQIQYEAGLIDFGDVLEAQRSLLGFQDEVAESEGTVAADVVRLYKALGGGWQAMTWTEGLEENPPSTEEKQG
jgi:NodT family efflux transporter outer membrane factor (OMF) lipoprotein